MGLSLNQGRAYIFIRSGASWTQQAILNSSDGATNDNFGYSVSISGDYVIVGASNKNVGANGNQGKGYVFNRDGTVWSQQATFIASEGAANDRFGTSVGINGNYIIVGAPFKEFLSGTTLYTDAGKVYFFLRQ